MLASFRLDGLEFEKYGLVGLIGCLVVWLGESC
jgi:hypothetical protein